MWVVVELGVHSYGDYHGLRAASQRKLVGVGVFVGECQQRLAKSADYPDDQVLRELLCAVDVV